MQIHIFNVSITDTGEQEAELNRFLSSHKVLEVEQRFFQNEKGCYWSFCVRYITDKVSGVSSFSSTRGKPDYKQILSETEFAVFSRLREIRRALATDDGVPAYAVFTDEELAGISRLPELTESGMKTVPGIGEKKVARYGKLMIDNYNKGKMNEQENHKEENRQ
jgi:superfamily II DNA helicase RecQ